MTEIIAKIMVELLSILGQAKKQIKHGRLSKRTLQRLSVAIPELACRAIRKEVIGGQRDREYIAPIRPAHPRRGPHDGGAYPGGCPRSDEQYESGYRW